MRNDKTASMRKKRSKYQIYKYIRFVVFSFIVIYSFYFKMHMPLSLVLVLEILLLVRTLPVRKFIERRLLTLYPRYRHFNVFLRKLILFFFYIMIFLMVKFAMVDLIMARIMDIPVDKQLNELMDKGQEEAMQELKKIGF